MAEQGQFSRELDLSDTEPGSAELAVEESAQETAEEEQTQNLEEEALAEQEDEANQLAAMREEEETSALQQADQLRQKGLKIGNPSLLKWGILLSLAIINDIIDLLALTGIGEIISWTVSLGLTALILIIMWMMDGDLKEAQAYSTQSQLFAQRKQIEEEVMKAAKWSQERLKNIPGFKKVGIRSNPRKNPLAKAFMGSAVESVPYLGAINLLTVWIFFAYLDERRAHKNAREDAEKIYGQSSQSTDPIYGILN